MRTLRVGIASYEQMKARTLAIARGKYKPAPGDPKIWFTSAESFARVLSDRNRALLGIIAESGPESLARLAELTGRKKSNLSRTPRERFRSVGLELVGRRFPARLRAFCSGTRLKESVAASERVPLPLRPPASI